MFENETAKLTCQDSCLGKLATLILLLSALWCYEEKLMCEVAPCMTFVATFALYLLFVFYYASLAHNLLTVIALCL